MNSKIHFVFGVLLCHLTIESRSLIRLLWVHFRNTFRYAREKFFVQRKEYLALVCDCDLCVLKSFEYVYWVEWKQTKWIGMSGKCSYWFTMENSIFLGNNKLKSFWTFTIWLVSKNYMLTQHGVNRMLVKNENGLPFFDSANAATYLELLFVL